MTATGIVVEPGIVYSRDAETVKRLDLYLPADRESAPAMVYLHGGAWVLGSRAETPERFRSLAAAGVAVASIEYTFIQKACWPAQCADIISAGNWLVRHGADAGLSVDELVLAGASAGAHLAALASAQLTDPATVRPAELPEFTVAATVGYFGSYDLTSVAPKPDPQLPKPVLPIDDATLEYFGGRLPSSTELKSLLTGVLAHELDDEALKHWSPRYRVHSRLPPLLLLHGDRDALTALEQSLDLQEAARQVGTEAEVVVVEGANHEGREFDSSDLAARVASFLRTHRQGENADR